MIRALMRGFAGMKSRALAWAARRCREDSGESGSRAEGETGPSAGRTAHGDAVKQADNIGVAPMRLFGAQEAPGARSLGRHGEHLETRPRRRPREKKLHGFVERHDLVHLARAELHEISGRCFQYLSFHGDPQPALQEIEELLVVVIVGVGMAVRRHAEVTDGGVNAIDPRGVGGHVVGRLSLVTAGEISVDRHGISSCK